MTGDVPGRQYSVPLGKGIIRRKGKDATAVSFSIMLHRTLEAADILAREGIDLEVIDPRTICPLDEELIFTSVKKTGRLAIVEPAVKTCGFAAEISARINERLFSKLKAPIIRICFPDAPTPASVALERLYYPDTKLIVEKIRKMLKGNF